MNYGEVEQVVVEVRHEPIISKEDFKKVQQIMDSHSKPIKLEISGKNKTDCFLLECKK